VLRADVVELEGDHACPWVHPDEFAAATAQLVEIVARNSSSAVTTTR
jgi:hypothetical protein